MNGSVCGAKTRSGGVCQGRPMKGQRRCRMHGGAAPQTRKMAARRLAEAEATKHVELWGGRRDITPAEALLELVQSKAAEVAWWEAKVNALDDGLRAGMLTVAREQGEQALGTVDTASAKPSASIFIQLLHKSQDQLAAYSAAALRAGVDEAMVKIATLQGHTILEFGRRVALAAGADADGVEKLLLGVIDETKELTT